MNRTIRRALRSIESGLLAAKLFVPSNRRAIFMFHDISPSTSRHFRPEYSTPPHVFQRQIELLARNFELVSLSSITRADKVSETRPAAAITFDDGFRTVRTEALPLLESKHIPFAVFVNRMAMENDALYNGSHNQLVQGGRSRLFLDPDDVVALSRMGVTIGNHSATHRDLAQCPSGELDEEVSGNKIYLEGLLGLPVRDFAFPFGDPRHCSEQAIRACFAAGHERAYSSNRRLFCGEEVPALRANQKLFPRIGLTGESPRQARLAINRARFRNVGP